MSGVHLGEGVNRMFGLSLAVEASRESNMLLVDEIENGIHYRVLPDLWNFIFTTARDAGIQVFATTHSWDCIEAFQQAAQAAPNTGVLIKLARKGDRVTGSVFSEQELAVATHLERRWASLRSILTKHAGAGCLPDRPRAGGTVCSLPEGPRLGIWLMPDNQLPGMLEDFVGFLVRPDDQHWAPARDYVENARTLGAKSSNMKASKARIHAWLAIQEDPGKPLGQAITARYLDAKTEVVSPLLAWLESLFLAS